MAKRTVAAILLLPITENVFGGNSIQWDSGFEQLAGITDERY